VYVFYNTFVGRSIKSGGLFLTAAFTNLLTNSVKLCAFCSSLRYAAQSLD